MKIKNMKLMLLGLIGLMGASNASAAVPVKGDKMTVDGVTYSVKADADVKKDETGRSVKNIVYNLYTIKWTAMSGTKTFETKEAYVSGVNSSASDAEVATLAIPAEVTGDKGTYQVVEINAAWYNGIKDVTGKTKSLSFDITNLKAALPATAYASFTALTSLAIIDASTSEKPLTASFDGSSISAKSKKTLTTLDLSKSRITEIADNGLKGFVGLTSFDFTGITKIGDYAFQGDCGISTLTIPASVETIGTDAFKGMYKAAVGTPGTDGYVPATGLTTLTINGASVTKDSDGKITASVIPAAFTGNKLLASVTVGSTTATVITSGAFANAPITTIDLSGATELATITGAFPNNLELTSVKLYGTKLTTLTTSDLKLASSQRTLATITLPAGLETLSQKFTGFMALTELDLSVTKVKNIPDDLFKINDPALYNERHLIDPTAEFKDGSGYAFRDKYLITPIYYDPALTTVKLNTETATIGDYAFNGCVALATVTGLNQPKLKSIGKFAFNKTALKVLDLSAATLNEDYVNRFHVIDTYAFGNIPTLTSITLPAQIDEIYPAAFANDGAVTSINLQDLTGLSVLNPIFHEGIVGSGWTSSKTFSGYTISIVDDNGGAVDEVAIPITSLTLPPYLWQINPGALQLLDIAQITIPASVSFIGEYALQGCIKLEKFEWNDAKSRKIYNSAFRGDDHLKSVKMVTSTTGSTIDIVNSEYYAIDDKSVDVIFKGNKKDVLTFTVNAEDYASFLAAGWTETNLHYCTISSQGASTYTFKPESKTGEYYYATYCNTSQATWFPAEDFEVFGAMVEGSNVVLVPATAEEGVYKVKKFEPCIIRSKKQEADYDLKNADFNNISTMPTDNDLQYGSVKASRLSYQYKLGIKGGVVAFYRISSGWVSGVYIQASTPSDRLNIVVEGEATAINGIATQAAENNGAIYNLNGVRVKSAQKGIYIQNGKKFVK